MLNKISRGERYNLSAHVLTVVGRFKLDGMVSANFLEDFLLVHDRFQHPDCVFGDDVSLYKITPTHLIFVQCRGNSSVWDVKAFPFSRLGQHKGAGKVITVPRESILRLVEESGYANSYRERFIFIGMTLRCGSTLLCQIFQETDKCITYSEPGVVNDLHQFGNDLFSESDAQDTAKYIRSSFMLLCKPVKDWEVVAHAVKFHPVATCFIRYLQGLFPDSSAIFTYRDVQSVFSSYLTVVRLFPLALVAGLMNLWSFDANYNFLVVNGVRPPNKQDYYTHLKQMITKVESFIFIDVCLAVAEYLKAREGKFPIAGVRYEDLVAEPETTLTKIFEHCRLPLELVAKALPAMQRDSQKGSPVDQQRLSKHRRPYKMSEEHRKDLKNLCQETNVPDLLNNEVLAGTL